MKKNITPIEINKENFLKFGDLISTNGLKEKPKTKNENTAQNIPAKTTVVNFGVSGFHLIVTEYKAKPDAEINPIIAPRALPEILSL